MIHDCRNWLPISFSGSERHRLDCAGGREVKGVTSTIPIVFWGVGSEAPGWLVACLSEFAQRGVNLTRIESRPRKQGLGRYMFFVDLEGHEEDAAIAAGLAGLGGRVERLKVLGTYPAA